MSDNKQLIEAFEKFLEETPESQQALPEIGLAQLFTELAALRTEVRTESRQFNRVMEEYRKLLTLLEREQQQYESRLKSFESQRLRPLLLDLVDVRDRLAAGVDALQVLRPGWLIRWLCKQRRLRFEAVSEGQRLTLERFDEMLAALDLEPIEVCGLPFDPQVMRAAEILHSRRHKEGEVIAEIRRGWYWRGEVLRLAEVKVNKIESSK